MCIRTRYFQFVGFHFHEPVRTNLSKIDVSLVDTYDCLLLTLCQNVHQITYGNVVEQFLCLDEKHRVIFLACWRGGTNVNTIVSLMSALFLQ